MNYFQFPWRFLSLSIFISSFLAGSLVSSKGKRSIIFAVILICLSIGLTYQYTKPAYYMQRTDQYYITRPNFISGTNSIGNSFNTIWFKEKENKSENTTKLHIAYFPGWEVFVNGEKVKIWPSKDGRVEFSSVKKGDKIETYFKDAPIRKFFTIVSALTFSLVLIWFFKSYLC